MYQFHDWKYLNNQQLTELENEKDVENMKEYLSMTLNPPYTDKTKRAIAVDFHFYNYMYCMDHAFDNRKTSTLMSILNDIFLHDMHTQDPADVMTISFTRFKDLLIKHSVERPPKSIEIFQRDEVPLILEYVIDSYYRRYKLLKYTLTDKLVINIKQTHPQEVEDCGNFPPLSWSVHYEESANEE